eukprot:ANDGO_01633.mRNA.1 LRR receptor-like serine/threonine-protein kinase GSO1
MLEESIFGFATGLANRLQQLEAVDATVTAANKQPSEHPIPSAKYHQKPKIGRSAYRDRVLSVIGEQCPGRKLDRQGQLRELPINVHNLQFVNGNSDAFPVDAIRSSNSISYDQDCAVLVDLYTSTDGPKWQPINWGSTLPLNFSTACCSPPLGGYSCDTVTGRVTLLDLHTNHLNGTIPASLGELLQLQILDLSSNFVAGPIPSSLGSLSQLRGLDLSCNQLIGSIPESFRNLVQLEVLDLSLNSLSGPLPASLSQLVQLRYLSLFHNQIGGSIPGTLDNLRSLYHLDLGSNVLNGSIPESLWGLVGLHVLCINFNRLNGSISSSVGNLVQLRNFYLDFNQLTGAIPSSICDLRYLLQLELSINRLTGPIPACIGHMSQLQYLELNSNHLSGPLPESIGNLSQLIYLDAHSNDLTGPIPDCLGNVSLLQYLGLDSNAFTGPIPASLGKLSRLLILDLSSNRLTGLIPEALGNLWQLQYLFLQFNSLSGSIPHSLGSLSDLLYLELYANQLNGSVPASLGSLAQLSVLCLYSNQLTGSIPATLGELTQLVLLDLHSNLLNGSIPTSLGNLVLLESLFLNDNQLSGELSCGSLSQHLITVNLQGNKFEGPIPACFCYFDRLQSAFLGKNNITSVPACALPSLVQLDLSSNRIPTFPFELISDFSSLISLDLSYNQFAGSFPVNVFVTPLPLRSLSLAYNNFADAFPLYFCNYLLPDGSLVSTSSNLETLDLSGNEITSIPGVLDFSTCEICASTAYDSLTTIKLTDTKLPSSFPGLSFEIAPGTPCSLAAYPFFGVLPFFVGLSSLDLAANDLSEGLDFVFSVPLLSFVDIRNNSHARKSELSLTYQQQFSFDPTTSYPYSTNMSCVQAVVGRLAFQADPVFFDYENCVCRPGFYGKPPQCLPCLPNAICSFGNEADIPYDNMTLAFAESGNVIAQVGYYASPPVTFEQMMNNKSYPKVIEICALAGTDLTACDGSRDGFCKQGYEGRLCSGCSSGYFRTGDRCFSCPDPVALVFFGIFVLLVVIGLFVWSFFIGSSSSSGLLKIFLFFWQALFFIRTPMPSGLYVFTHGSSSASTLILAGPECFFRNWTDTSNFILAVCAPVCAVAVVFCIWVIGLLRLRSVSPQVRHKWMDKCFRSSIFWYLFLFMSAVSAALAQLSCVTDPGEDKSYLLFHPNEECSPSLQVISSIVVVFYAVLIPAFLSYLVWNSGALSDVSSSDPREMYVCSLIFRSYRPSRRWWELVVTLRRMLFVLAFVTISPLSEYRIFLVSSVLVASGIVQAMAAPYQHPMGNSMEIISLGILLVNLVCSVQSQVLAVEDVDGVGTMVFLLNTGFSAVLITMLASHFRQRWQKQTNWEVSESLSENFLEPTEAL